MKGAVVTTVVTLCLLACASGQCESYNWVGDDILSSCEFCWVDESACERGCWTVPEDSLGTWTFTDGATNTVLDVSPLNEDDPLDLITNVPSDITNGHIQWLNEDEDVGHHGVAFTSWTDHSGLSSRHNRTTALSDEIDVSGELSLEVVLKAALVEPPLIQGPARIWSWATTTSPSTNNLHLGEQTEPTVPESTVSVRAGGTEFYMEGPDRSAIATNEIVHVVVNVRFPSVGPNSTVDLYIDGVLRSSQTGPSNYPDLIGFINVGYCCPDPSSIGRRWRGGVYFSQLLPRRLDIEEIGQAALRHKMILPSSRGRCGAVSSGDDGSFLDFLNGLNGLQLALTIGGTCVILGTLFTACIVVSRRDSARGWETKGIDGSEIYVPPAESRQKVGGTGSANNSPSRRNNNNSPSRRKGNGTGSSGRKPGSSRKASNSKRSRSNSAHRNKRKNSHQVPIAEGPTTTARLQSGLYDNFNSSIHKSNVDYKLSPE